MEVLSGGSVRKLQRPLRFDNEGYDKGSWHWVRGASCLFGHFFLLAFFIGSMIEASDRIAVHTHSLLWSMCLVAVYESIESN